MPTSLSAATDDAPVSGTPDPAAPSLPAPPWIRFAARSGPRAVAWGLCAGAVLGALYRAFMVLLAPDPSFTWRGTLLIVGLVTVAATTVAVCMRARAAWSSRWAVGTARAVAGLAFLALWAGPGAVTLPATVLGGLALGRTGAPRWLRGLGLLLAAAPAGALALAERELIDQLGAVRFAVGVLAFLGVGAVHAAAFAAVVGGVRRPGRAAPAAEALTPGAVPSR